jgi:hypothetical protein
MTYVPNSWMKLKLQCHTKGFRKKIGKNRGGGPKEFYWPKNWDIELCQMQAWWIMCLWDARCSCASRNKAKPVTWQTPLTPNRLIMELYAMILRRKPQLRRKYHCPSLRLKSCRSTWDMEPIIKFIYALKGMSAPHFIGPLEGTHAMHENGTEEILDIDDDIDCDKNQIDSMNLIHTILDYKRE